MPKGTILHGADLAGVIPVINCFSDSDNATDGFDGRHQ